jgi:plasmid stability protein
MANLTVTIDEEVLRRARIRALQHGTSVNALLRGYLEAYGSDPELARAMDEFLALAGQSQAGGSSRGRSWTRDDAYDR